MDEILAETIEDEHGTDAEGTVKFSEEIGEANENTITGNQCHGNAEGGIRVSGEDTQVMANIGKVERP